jgi:hypothetical protein
MVENIKTDIAYIYALIDPRNNEVRYIGKSIDPKSRLISHLYIQKDDNSHKSKWVKKLLRENLKPQMKILKICPLSEFIEHETYYISQYNFDRLVNSDKGGQGNIGRKQEILDRQTEKISRIVYQYDLYGDFIKEYKSTRQASRYLNMSHSNISRCCNGISKHSGGFIFRYDNNSIIEKVIKPNAVKKIVIEIDKYGNEINIWNSIMSCNRETGLDYGNLSKVCNGISKHIKGRFFKYKMD